MRLKFPLRDPLSLQSGRHRPRLWRPPGPRSGCRAV